MADRHSCATTRLLAGLLALLWGILFSAEASHAQSVQISPLRLMLEEGGPVGAFTLRNHGSRPAIFQVEIRPWDLRRRGNESAPTEGFEEFIVTPPIFEVGPGSSQTVRVALRGAFPDQQEAAYRAVFRQIPPTGDDAAGIHLRFQLNFSVPVFATPARARPGQVRWHGQLDETGGEVVVRGHNVGERHVRITNLILRSDDTGGVVARQERLRYVLPGREEEWRLLLESPVVAGASLLVEAVSGGRKVSGDDHLDWEDD